MAHGNFPDPRELQPVRGATHMSQSLSRDAALLHEDPAGVGRFGLHFSGPSAGATLQG